MSAPAAASGSGPNSVAPAISGSGSGSKRSLPGTADGRRVQARHFHFGPNPAAAGAIASADVEGCAPPPAARLYRHALESVFAFLGRRELAMALRVSRGWLAAATSMRSLELTVRSEPAAPFRVVVDSAMGRHATALGAYMESLQLNLAALHAIARQMPQLRRLHCDLQLPPPDQPLLLPPNLHISDVDTVPPTGTDQVNRAIAAISRLPLLEELTIGLPASDPLIYFTPLAAMPQLVRLHLWSRGGNIFSDAQVGQLRVLSQLREISLPMTTALLRRLLRQPHQLQWQRISMPQSVDDEFAALLPQLPSLTQIHSLVECGRFEWLRGLPNLTEVDLSFYMDDDDERAASLMAGLQCCTNIKILELGYCSDLTAAHLANLLLRLPQLRELTLSSLRIDSLSFLSRPPMTTQLSTVELQSCRRLPLIELRHVHPLHGLKKLVFWDSFTTPLDDYCRSLFTPPSPLLPLLEQFDYMAPDLDDDAEEHE